MPNGRLRVNSDMSDIEGDGQLEAEQKLERLRWGIKA